MNVRKNLLALLTFVVMYLIATVVGFATYVLISPTAMLVAVFTFMPLVCALLITGYLAQVRASVAGSARDTAVLVAVWIVLSILFDAVTYILVVPAVTGASPNWGFFTQQSPWIWYAYLVLVLCGVAGRWLYVARFARNEDGKSTGGQESPGQPGKQRALGALQVDE